MAEDIHHLVSRFKAIDQQLAEVVSSGFEPPQAQVDALDVELAATFDTILEVVPVDHCGYLERIGFLLDRLVQSTYSDELRAKFSNKIMEDATKLTKPS